MRGFRPRLSTLMLLAVIVALGIDLLIVQHQHREQLLYMEALLNGKELELMDQKREAQRVQYLSDRQYKELRSEMEKQAQLRAVAEGAAGAGK